MTDYTQDEEARTPEPELAQVQASAQANAKPVTHWKECSAKEEAFAILVANGHNQSDAYRQAFKPKPGVKPEVVHANASKVAGRTWVRERIEEIRTRRAAVAVAAQAVTTETLLAECDEALNFARDKCDAQALVAATKLKAMLTGNLVKERDNARAPLTDVTEDAVIAELQRLRQERETARSVH